MTTFGFKDLCLIGTQKRPNIFDLNIRKPGVLYDKVIEVHERVTVEDYVLNPYPSQYDFDDPALLRTESGEVIRIIEKLDIAKTRVELENLKAEGYNSLAVCLLHSYIFPDHERKIAEMAKEVGFEFVSISSDLSKQIKFLNRSNSACADAYLQSTVRHFVDGFSKNFSAQPQRLDFMQSDGGLVSGSKFCGLRAILSGPAGGV